MLRSLRRAGLLILAALALVALVAYWPERLHTAGLVPPPGRYDVRILRDTWGVPHVFGRRDADVAYGLAWANAEDDFPTIQGALLAARGRLASAFGREAAPNDYMVALLRVPQVVERGWPTLRAETRALCQAYADGINHYAALHPGQALPALYPATGQDVIAGFVHKTPLFFGLDKTLRRLFAEERVPPPSPEAEPEPEPTPVGSNTFAVGPARSSDGATRLLVNSHQPWEGPVAWYEVHLHSEEGWEATGGVFPGAPVVLHGHNRHLGWAHTVNRPDLIDVYVLEINPENPNQYRFDGAWRDLEVRDAPIEVKLLGRLHWTVHREVLWSVHGPVVRRPHGTYALRLAGYGEVRQVEQWYLMNRARNLEEWLGAMRLQALPMFNVGYADEAGHIGYLYNAKLPRRAPGYDWHGDLPGNTSATLWSEYLPFQDLPWVLDPPSGFVQNANSSPFHATLGPGNPDPARYPASLGIERRDTNRALRMLALLGADEQISREDFEAIKYDMTYAPGSAAVRAWRRLVSAPAPADAPTREAWEVLKRWDQRADPANLRTALALLTLQPSDSNAEPPTDAALWERLQETAAWLKQHHGKLEVSWQEVLRLRRGSVDLGLGGGPDLLRAVYPERQKDGRLKGIVGDSLIYFVEWDREGRLRSRSIHNYGSATRDERSPHFADQSPLFARQELKPVWMDEAEIRAHLEREYRPGVNQ
ncbi:MAG TPA: acylase [Vicinamibacteria bacterium]